MKKIKKRILISTVVLIVYFSIVAGIIAYFYYVSHCIQNSITKFQYYQLSLMVISAALTLLAVIVALFKDSIISYFKFSDLIIKQYNDAFLDEITVEENTITRATRYFTHLKVANIGNKEAANCIIIIDEIDFLEDINSTPISLQKKLSINNLLWPNGDSEITIYSNYSQFIEVISVLPASRNIDPNNSESQKNSGVLMLGNSCLNEEHKEGLWRIKLSVCSKDSKVLQYDLEISYKSEWRDRKTEMSRFCKIKNIKK